jgi:hypothetical protein
MTARMLGSVSLHGGSPAPFAAAERQRTALANSALEVLVVCMVVLVAEG